MREFTKHLLLALEEDEWELSTRSARHIKSRLRIDLDDMQLENAPFEFTWWERKLITRAFNRMKERVILAKFIEYRINPRKIGPYESGNDFL